MIAQKKLEYGQVRCRGPPSCYWTKVFKLTNNNKEYNMTKYEMICKIKEEIKLISLTLKENKNNFKYNQKVYSKAPLVDINYGKIKSIISKDYKKIHSYPFTTFYSGFEEIDGKKYFKGNYWNFNPGSETAKCHLTCLHIVYNMLRTKKTHCHNIERNDYYVKYLDKLIQGYLSQVEAEQNVVV